MRFRLQALGYVLAFSPLMLNEEDRDTIITNLDCHEDRVTLGLWYVTIYGWRHKLDIYGPSYAIR